MNKKLLYLAENYDLVINMDFNSNLVINSLNNNVLFGNLGSSIPIKISFLWIIY